jgi:hypothetical protein
MAMNLNFLPTGQLQAFADAVRDFHLPRPLLFAGGILLVLLAAWLLLMPQKRKVRVARLGGLTWRRSQFCRSWRSRSEAEYQKS